MKMFASLSLGIFLFAQSARAEDPLLGQIKVIKCVGCVADKVTLIIHDPIEVRDFEVTIMNSDYEKIVTPLPGKMVYEGANSCFYWNETPKVEKKTPKVDSANPGQNPVVNPISKKTPPLKKGKKDLTPVEDSTSAAGEAMDTVSTQALPVEVKQSKCLPFQIVVPPKVGKPK